MFQTYIMNAFFSKTITIIIYLIIIIMILLFLDYLFKLTIRHRRKQKIKQLANKQSIKKKKPLLILNNNEVLNLTGKEIIDKLAKKFRFSPNTCVVMISEVLEYVESDFLEKVINQLLKISGGDLYIACIEKNSPRGFWDYKIKNIMNKSFYLPNEKIEWTKPNELQLSTQRIYYYVFKIIPYDFFIKDNDDKKIE